MNNEKKILLHHPLWDEPRSYDYEHGMKFIALAKKRNLIVEIVGTKVDPVKDDEEFSPSKEIESDVDSSENQGNPESKSNRKQNRNSKGKRSGK